MQAGGTSARLSPSAWRTGALPTWLPYRKIYIPLVAARIAAPRPFQLSCESKTTRVAESTVVEAHAGDARIVEPLSLHDSVQGAQRMDGLIHIMVGKSAWVFKFIN